MKTDNIVDIERAILSSILFDIENIHDISLILTPGDFYIQVHADIFDTMLLLMDKDLPIDEIFIQQHSKNKIDDNTLISILSANAISNPKAYATTLKDASIKRSLIKISNDIKKSIIEDEMNSHDALEFAQNELSNISTDSLSHGLKSTHDIVNDFHSRFLVASEKKEITGVKTKISKLDNILGSLEAGKLVVVGARPSMGKTALATTITKNILSQGHGVLFDSLEMDSSDLMRRLIANYTEDNINDFKKGVCRSVREYEKALDFYKTSNLILHDVSYPTLRQIRSKATKIFRKNQNIKVWIIDHLRYIKTPTKDRHLEVGNITKEIKNIAKEFGVVAILLTQLNREVQQKTRNDHRPNLSDLRDSGSIEEDADIVIFPHRPSYYTRTDPAMPEKSINDAELIIAKNRDGLTGVAKCLFNGPSTKFFDGGYSVTTYEPSYNDVDIPDL